MPPSPKLVEPIDNARFEHVVLKKQNKNRIESLEVGVAHFLYDLMPKKKVVTKVMMNKNIMK